MKFEVRYPTGTVHEVELQGSLAVLGRDPSCDLVVNDAKCSRRHAVVEAGPDGLSIRDSGSANGVYVNAKRVERSPLQPGDEIRLGEVLIKVMPEEVAGTLVMGPDEIVEMAPPLPRAPRLSDSTPTVPPAVPGAPAPPPPAPVPLPPPPPPMRSAPLPSRSTATPPPSAIPTAPAAVPPLAPAPAPARSAPAPPAASGPAARPVMPRSSAPERLPRPLTATVLAVLWLVSAAFSVLGCALAIWTATRGGPGWIGALAWNAAVLVLGIALGVGLLGRHPWARILEIAVSALGLLTCIFTPLSALCLYYMMRPATQIQFSGRQTFRELTPEEGEIVRAAEGEAMFTGGVFVCLVLGFILAVLAALAIPALMMRGATGP